MANLLNEMKEAMISGVQRLIAADQAQKQVSILSPGRTLGSATNVAGGNGILEDQRFTTGYDAGTGLTTVAFVVGASPLDGDDGVTM